MPEELQNLAETVAAPSSEEQNQSTESATEEQQQETEGAGEETTSEQPKPVKGGFQKRIDRLTKEKEFWKQEALKTKPVAEQTQTETEGKKPSASDYQTSEEFVEALTEWKVEQKLQSVDTDRRKQEAIAPLLKAQQDFAASVDDYHDTMAEASDVPVNEMVLTYVRDPEIGPQLGYFLAKNPDEAHKLVTLGPSALAKAISALESRFLKSSPSETTATVSKAPKPPSPVRPTGSGSTKDPSEITDMDEWRAYRLKMNPDYDRA